MSSVSKAVQDEVAKLRRRLRRAPKPQEVVDLAFKKPDIFGAYITFDDTEAARKRRLDEARYILANCPMRVENGTSKLIIPSRWVHDPDASGEQAYLDIADILPGSEKAYVTVLAECQRVQSALDRAEAYAEQLGFGEELHEVRQRAVALRSRVEQKRGASHAGGEDA